MELLVHITGGLLAVWSFSIMRNVRNAGTAWNVDRSDGDRGGINSPVRSVYYSDAYGKTSVKSKAY